MGFFAKQAETKGMHRDAGLRTHYYKTNYNKIKQQIENYASQHKLTIRNINDEYKEILIQQRGYHIVVSCTQINPLNTAVDLKVEHYGMIVMNRPAKIITRFYQFLDSNLPLKEVGVQS